MSLTYSSMVLSEENLPAQAVFIMAILAQDLRFLKASPTRLCASA